MEAGTNSDCGEGETTDSYSRKEGAVRWGLRWSDYERGRGEESFFVDSKDR